MKSAIDNRTLAIEVNNNMHKRMNHYHLFLLLIGKAITENNPVSPVHTVCTVWTTNANAAASFSSTPKHIKVAMTIKCHDDIAVEKILEEEKTLPPEKVASDPISQAKAAVDDGKTKVFIEQTKFYNDTATNAFHSIPDIVQ